MESKRYFCLLAYTHLMTDARVRRIANSASGAGYVVDIITPSEPDRHEAEDRSQSHITLPLRAYHGSSRFRYMVSYFAFFVLALVLITLKHLRQRYAVIHVCNMPDFLVFAAAPAKAFGAKLVLDIHDSMPQLWVAKRAGRHGGLGQRLLVLQERLSAAFADRIITVHEPLKNDILTGEGLDPGKITVVANFPDGELFQPVPDHRFELPLRLVFHGTIAPRFGFETVLEALGRAERIEDIRVKILGEGEFAGRLREQILERGLGRIVDLDNHAVAVQELPAILGQFHLGLVSYSPSPATAYMLPVKLLELLAMGIPSIVPPNKAIRHYLDESVYFAYDPSDPGSLAAILDRLAREPAEIMKKRTTILARRERYLWEGERRKYIGLLDSLSS